MGFGFAMWVILYIRVPFRILLIRVPYYVGHLKRDPDSEKYPCRADDPVF